MNDDDATYYANATSNAEAHIRELEIRIADDERWERTLLNDFRIPFDDHPAGRRFALALWMKERQDKGSIQETCFWAGYAAGYVTGSDDAMAYEHGCGNKSQASRKADQNVAWQDFQL